jgi:hypothetical protein
MRAIKLQARIGSDHMLHLQLPVDLAEGPAEIIVLVPDATEPESDNKTNLETFLDKLERGPRHIRSKDEIDRYLTEERESWER